MPDTGTGRHAEPVRKAQEGMARASESAIDGIGKATKEALSHGEQATQHAADKVRDVARAMASSAAETAEAVTDVSSKVATQGREVMMQGVRTAADVSGRIADISFGRGHHLLASTAQAMDVYSDAAERSAGNVQALFTSYATLGRGIQQMQHAWLEMLDQTIENAAHKPQDLLRCRNIVELAEVQRDLYLDTIHHVFGASSRLLEMAGRTAQDAVRPLQASRH